MVQDENSLLHRVLKARYFHDSLPNVARVGRNVFYLWKSLLESRMVIEQGSYWRVGDGKSIDVWRDRWIKIPPDFKVQWSGLANPIPLKVENLLLDDRRGWNMSMVREVLCEEDAGLVETIPLCKTSKPDRLIWIDFVTGMFTVKSAYYVARNILSREQLPRDSRVMVWRKLWTTKVAPKIKYFMWRLFQGILSTRMRLREKEIILESECVVCGTQRESIKHLFFECEMSKVLWNEMDLELLV